MTSHFLFCGVLAGVVFASLRKAFRDPKVWSSPPRINTSLTYHSQLDEIPVVGSSGFLSSYRDALNFLHNAPELIQRGYDLYPEGIFRVSRLFRYEYVVCGPRLIKDLGAASEHVVSFTEGVEEVRTKASLLVISNLITNENRASKVCCFIAFHREIPECSFYSEVHHGPRPK